MIDAVLENVARKLAHFNGRAMDYPSWLRKQTDAVYLMETDPERGLAQLIDGLQDEMDKLGDA